MKEVSSSNESPIPNGKRENKLASEQIAVGNPAINLMHRLRQELQLLSPAERQIGRFILEQPFEALKLPLDQLARQIGVSQGTVINFCQALGYSGFKDFRLKLAAELNSPVQLLHSAIAPDDDLNQIANKVISANIDGLLTTLKELNMLEVEQAIQALSKARKIDLYGFGVSSAVALDAFSRFFAFGSKR